MDEMISFSGRVFFFIASFSPIWIILLGAYLMNDHSPLAIITCFLIILGIIGTIVQASNQLARYRKSINTDPVYVTNAKDVTYKYTKHLIAYVFLALIDVTLQHNVFILASLIVFLCLVYSRTNMVLTSPALFVIGFKMYECRVTRPERDITLLSRSVIKKHDAIGIKEIASNIFVENSGTDPQKPKRNSSQSHV